MRSLVSKLLIFSITIQMVVPSYAQNGEADVQVMQIRECFDHILDSETLSPENLARFDLGNGVAPDELSMLKGLTLWSLDMKDYHEYSGGINPTHAFNGSLVFTIIIGVLLFVANSIEPLNSAERRVNLKITKIGVPVVIVSLVTTLIAYGRHYKSYTTKQRNYFESNVTDIYIQSIMNSNDTDDFWERLEIDSPEGRVQRQRMIVGCGNIASLKQYFEVEPDRILTDFSDRNEASDLKPVFRTQDGQSFVMDDKIIAKIAQELEKDKVNVPKVASLLEQATDTAGTANSPSSTLPRARSNIAENPITTCASDLSGIYQVKDLKTQKTSYWKIQSQYGSKESYQIAVNATNDFSNPTWITASVGQTTSPASNINHCSITYYDDLSSPSIYLILKQEGSGFTLGKNKMMLDAGLILTRIK